MSGLNVRSAFGKLQDALFSKDLRKENFITGQKLGSSRRGLDTIALSVYLVADDVVEAGSTNNLVKLTGHVAKEGDFLQIKTSANGIKEFEVSIDEIVDVDNIRLGCILSADLATGDTVSILRVITPRMSSTGATLATIEDTPLSFMKDGVSVDVTEDTVDANNNEPLPVKLMGVDGPITLNADQINVHNSHTGANPDSVQIGDGTTLMGITVSNEAKTNDSAANIKLTSLLTELQLKADLSETQPVSVASLPLPSGAATSALQTTGNSSLSSIDTKLSSQATAANQASELTLIGAVVETAPASDTASSGLNGRLQRIAQRLTSLIALLPSSLGTKTAANSLAVTLSSDGTVPLPTGAATSALQTTGNTSLSSLVTNLGAVADASVSNPASSASVIAALKGLMTLITSTNTKLDTLETNTSPNLDSVANTTTVTNTLFTAPASARGMIIQNSTNAESGIRWTASGVTPSASVGFFLGPGQSTSYMPAGSFRTISVDAGAIDVSVAWFV